MPQNISRRDFLALAGIGGASLAAFGPSTGGRAAAAGPRATAAARAVRSSAPADVASRVLVVLAMDGGNDGMSMAPQDDLDRLVELRPTAAHAPDSYLRPGHDVVLHPALSRLAARPVCVVDGLGSPTPDGSHFEMMRRWWTGDPAGDSGVDTGVLGRLCDALDAGAPATGVSIGGGSSPALLSAHAGTIGLPESWWLWWLAAEDDDWAEAYREGLAAMTAPDSGDGALLALARSNLATGLDAGAMVAHLDEDELPDDDLARKLAMATLLIDADIGVRVIHVPVDGDFDTHEDHLGRHDELMATLDAGVDGFFAGLTDRGLDDRVLVATTSEFGRRPEENGSAGLDHGTAAPALLIGPLTPGRVGEPVSLDRLDDDGNFVSTVAFDRYFATIAERWFEVPAADVVPSGAAPIDGVW